MRAATALAELLKADAEWRGHFKAACGAGPLRLRAFAPRFRDELRDRGHGDLALVDVEDALLAIARKVLPATAAARWDREWAADLCDDALSRLCEHHAGLTPGERGTLDFSAQRMWEERMDAAAGANDPAAFRAALGGWERATLEAMWSTKAASGRGAA